MVRGIEVDFRWLKAGRAFWSSMNFVSRLLLLASREAVLCKSYLNWPPLHAGIIDPRNS